VSFPAGIKDLRPLSLGELIDRCAIFWRAHIVPLFALGFGFQLLDYIFKKSVALTLERTSVLFQNPQQLEAQIQDDPIGVMSQVGIATLAVVLLVIVLTWSYWLSTLVVARYVVPIQLGESARPADGLRRGLRRLGALTGAYLLSLLWGLGVGLLLMVPGFIVLVLGAFVAGALAGSGTPMVGVVISVLGVILVGLGALAAFLWYFLRFSVLGPVFAMEELSALGAFRRSGALLSGRVAPGFLGRVKVRAMILLTAVGGIVIAVTLIFSLPGLIVHGAYGQLTDPSAAASHPIPQALLVPVELFEVLGQSIFLPLALVFSAMFYLDLRMRREGLDLERRLAHRNPAP
jgi:hypothetical protein